MTPTKPAKLDLACGQTPEDGFEGVDIWPGARHVVNLWKFPWPWADDSIDELRCSHHIEHIPMTYIGPDNQYRNVPESWEDKELFIAFMDECWRILKKSDDSTKPAGIMRIYCPCARSNRAYQDFSHRRFIVEETFLYLMRDWRVQCKLDHYRVDCNFVHEYRQIIKKGLLRLSPEARQERCQGQWNAVADLDVTLIALR